MKIMMIICVPKEGKGKENQNKKIQSLDNVRPPLVSFKGHWPLPHRLEEHRLYRYRTRSVRRVAGGRFQEERGVSGER